MADPEFLAVARLKKPHGLNGEAYVWVLTDQPDAVLGEGRELTPLDDEGSPAGPPLQIERSRPYHRQWLLKFRGLDDRTALEQWGQTVFGVRTGELEAPAPDELYRHEISGAEVVAGGRVVGKATGLIDVPGGSLLAVDMDGREVLIPFRRPIVQRVVRTPRRIEVDAPPGLFEV